MLHLHYKTKVVRPSQGLTDCLLLCAPCLSAEMLPYHLLLRRSFVSNTVYSCLLSITAFMGFLHRISQSDLYIQKLDHVVSERARHQTEICGPGFSPGHHPESWLLA